MQKHYENKNLTVKGKEPAGTSTSSLPGKAANGRLNSPDVRSHRDNGFRLPRTVDATSKKAFLGKLPTAGAYWVSESAASGKYDATLAFDEGVVRRSTVGLQTRGCRRNMNAGKPQNQRDHSSICSSRRSPGSRQGALQADDRDGHDAHGHRISAQIRSAGNKFA